MTNELQSKLAALNAQLLALTGSQGVDVLHEMPRDAADAYLTHCQQLAAECLRLSSAD